MVNYQEGDPTAAGNASLESHELRAFERGDVTAVTLIGRQHGAFCTEYAIRNGGEVADMGLGAKTLARQPEQTLTSFTMGIPFMEGIMDGVHEVVDDANLILDNPQLIQLVKGMKSLSELGKRPDVMAVVAQEQGTAYDNLMSALRDINGNA